MRRWLAPVAVIASIVLFCAIAIAWLYSALDPAITVQRTFHGIALVPDDHPILDQPEGGPELLEGNLSVMRTAARGGFALLGFQYWVGGARNAGVGGIEEFWFIVIPYWSLLLLTGAGPAWWLYQRRRRKYRREHGLCVACGYDVRASNETCPECGAATPGRVAATAAEGVPV